MGTHWEGKRINSPNDVTVKSNGDIYFSDPIYGLETLHGDPSSAVGREIDFTGVYRIPYGADPTKIELVTKELMGPNGLAFSPDESKLYITNTGIEKE